MNSPTFQANVIVINAKPFSELPSKQNSILYLLIIFKNRSLGDKSQVHRELEMASYIFLIL